MNNGLQATIVFQKTWDAIHAINEQGKRKYRYIIHKGSSRSSKTYSLIDVYDLYARENSDKRLTVWRDTKTDCRKTVLNDTLKHLKKTGRYMLGHEFNKTESIFSYNTGSTFEIHGTDDDETVHGLQQSAAWFNEPYKISKEVFDQIDQRTEDFVVLDLNPKKAHWSDDLEKDPRAIVIHSTFRDNPFCPVEQKLKILSYQPVSMCDIVLQKLLNEQEAKAYCLLKNEKGFTDKQIKELRRCRENEEKKSANAYNWAVYGLGLKAERPNRIFRWEEISDEKYKSIQGKIYTGTDWGVVDPWAIGEVKYYDGALYVHEHNYLSETELKSRLSLTELAQISGDDEGMVKHMFQKLGIDKSREIICDSNRPLKIAALRRAGWAHAYPAVKAANSIIDGISLLTNIPVYYTSSSINIKYEQENYSRQVDRYGIVLEEPEDTDNHHMDWIRYVAMYLHARGVIKKT